MKRLFKIVGIVLCMLLLTGCAKVTSLTSEENNIIAEYAAGVLIGHSFYYEGKYSNNKEDETETETETAMINPEETESNKETETNKDSEHESETTPSNEFNCAEAIGVSPLNIVYNSYKLVDSYPDDEDVIFYFDADDGYKILIINFKLYNPTDKDVTVNTSNKHPLFKATINSKNKYNNYGNLLLNDLSNLKNVTVEAGKSTDVVIAFMVDKDVCNDISSLVISYPGNSSELKLK